MESWCG